MRSPLFAVASLAVDVTIGTIASVDGVQCLGAVLTLEAFTMPRATFGQDFFGCEDDTSATGASLTWWGLDASGVDDSNLWGLTTDGEGVALEGATALTVPVTLGTELLAVTNFTIDVLVRTLGHVDGV